MSGFSASPAEQLTIVRKLGAGVYGCTAAAVKMVAIGTTGAVQATKSSLSGYTSALPPASAMVPPKEYLIGAGVAVGVVAGVALVPAALGFGAGGILAGTPGAYLMSLYGGATPAGGIVATLQSAGALGVYGSTAAAVKAATVGTTVAVAAIKAKKMLN